MSFLTNAPATTTIGSFADSVTNFAALLNAINSNSNSAQKIVSSLVEDELGGLGLSQVVNHEFTTGQIINFAELLKIEYSDKKKQNAALSKYRTMLRRAINGHYEKYLEEGDTIKVELKLATKTKPAKFSLKIVEPTTKSLLEEMEALLERHESIDVFRTLIHVAGFDTLAEEMQRQFDDCI